MKGTAGARARYSDDSGNSVAVLACDKVCDWAATGAGGSGQAREEMQDRGAPPSSAQDWMAIMPPTPSAKTKKPSLDHW